MNLLVLPLLLAVAACGGGDGTVTVKGDVPDLDIAALRGDSLVAEATRPLLDPGSLADYTDSTALPVDSVRETTPATARPLARSAATATTVAGPGDNPMSRRAQARGDSMARASARAYASALKGASRAGGDSARGVVTLTGTAPARQTVLKDRNGAIITMSGMATSGLARLEGAEVVVRGVRITPRDVVVSDYIVRSVNGNPAWDGRLEESTNGWTLQLTDGSGRKRISAMPSGLRGLAGSRVWVSIRTGETPIAFGLIGRR